MIFPLIFHGVVGVLLLAVFSGLATGLIALGRGRRGEAWWLLAIGIAISLVGPVIYLTVAWQTVAYQQAYIATGRAGLPPPPPPAIDVGLSFGIGGLACILGLLTFFTGFVRHGLDSARRGARRRALEQAVAEMDRVLSPKDTTKAWWPRDIALQPELDMAPKRAAKATVLLACVAAGTGLWACWAGVVSLSKGEKGWLLVCLIVVMAIAIGIWTGLNELKNAHAGTSIGGLGAAGWLMASGALCSVGPASAILLMTLTDARGDPDELWFLAIPPAIVLFATGFALHGLRVLRQGERMAELEQVRAALEEEIARPKQAH